MHAKFVCRHFRSAESVQTEFVLRESTGLPIGDCAGSFNDLVPRGTKLSAIDVTAKAFFEHLYLTEPV